MGRFGADAIEDPHSLRSLGFHLPTRLALALVPETGVASEDSQRITWSNVLGKTQDTFLDDLTRYITRDGDLPVAASGCADIYKGSFRDGKRQIDMKVAIKAIRAYFVEDNHPKKKRRLRRQLKSWIKLDHPNVLPLFGTTSGFGPFDAIVCPWLENGTLTSYLKSKHTSLEIVRILVLVYDVASGLQYLHSKNIVHGDLSGSNVLIDTNGRACITDFGLSMLLGELAGSTFATTTSTGTRGTLRWAAPELLGVLDEEYDHTHSKPTKESDIYSFGSIMFQILSGNVPYHYYSRYNRILGAIFRGETPRRPDSDPHLTDHRWNFIQRCWTPFKLVDQRPSSNEIATFSKEDLVDNCLPAN